MRSLSIKNTNTFVLTNTDESTALQKVTLGCQLDSHNAWVKSENKWHFISVVKLEDSEKVPNFKVFGYTPPNKQITGWSLKNEAFVAAIFDDKLVLFDGSKEVIETSLHDLTMCVSQRNTPKQTRFDIIWCYASKQEIIESTFSRQNANDVFVFLKCVTEDVYDSGPDPYNWPRLLKLAKKEMWEDDDWIGVFSPLTDNENDDDDNDEDFVAEEEDEDDDDDDDDYDDDDDDDEDDEFEDYVTSEEEEDGESWTSDNDTSEDDEYQPPTKKQRR